MCRSITFSNFSSFHGRPTRTLSSIAPPRSLSLFLYSTLLSLAAAVQIRDAIPGVMPIIVSVYLHYIIIRELSNFSCRCNQCAMCVLLLVVCELDERWQSNSCKGGPIRRHHRRLQNTNRRSQTLSRTHMHTHPFNNQTNYMKWWGHSYRGNVSIQKSGITHHNGIAQCAHRQWCELLIKYTCLNVSSASSHTHTFILCRFFGIAWAIHSHYLTIYQNCCSSVQLLRSLRAIGKWNQKYKWIHTHTYTHSTHGNRDGWEMMELKNAFERNNRKQKPIET